MSNTKKIMQMERSKYNRSRGMPWLCTYAFRVDIAGKNAVKIKEYIKNQLKEDELGEQLTFSSTDPFIGGK